MNKKLEYETGLPFKVKFAKLPDPPGSDKPSPNSHKPKTTKISDEIYSLPYEMY